MLTFAEEAAFQRFAEQIIRDLRHAIHNKPVSNFGTSPVNASGRLDQSLEYVLTEDGVQILANDYIYYLEYGRGPTGTGTGKGSGGGNGQTLYQSILQWLNDKLIFNLNFTQETLAFLITRKIHREGTTIYRQFKGRSSGFLDDIITEQSLLDLSDELGESMIQFVTSEILKDIELEPLKITVE